MQRSCFLVLLLPLALGGCFSFSSSDPPPPDRATVVVPQSNTAVVCNPSPCQ